MRKRFQLLHFLLIAVCIGATIGCFGLWLRHRLEEMQSLSQYDYLVDAGMGYMTDETGQPVRLWVQDPALIKFDAEAIRVPNRDLRHHLVELDLSGSDIDDSFVDEIRSFSSLERLNIAGTNISTAAVSQLRRDRPNCKITY